jgi:hypothetical protein
MVLLLSSVDLVISAITAFIGTTYFFGVLFVVIALIYFISKRIKDKKKETFEDRDN